MANARTSISEWLTTSGTCMFVCCCFFVVIVMAEQPFIRIDQCKSESSEGCLIQVSAVQDHFNLTCSVVGAKPQVSLFWEESGVGYVTDAEAKHHQRQNDGTWNTVLTMRRKTSEIGESADFKCIATGEAVNGRVEEAVQVAVDFTSAGNVASDGFLVTMAEIKQVFCQFHVLIQLSFTVGLWYSNLI